MGWTLAGYAQHIVQKYLDGNLYQDAKVTFIFLDKKFNSVLVAFKDEKEVNSEWIDDNANEIGSLLGLSFKRWIINKDSETEKMQLLLRYDVYE